MERERVCEVCLPKIGRLRFYPRDWFFIGIALAVIGFNFMLLGGPNTNIPLLSILCAGAVIAVTVFHARFRARQAEKRERMERIHLSSERD